MYIRPGNAVHGTSSTWLGIGIKYGDQCQANRIERCGFFYLGTGVLAYGLDDSLVIERSKFIRNSTAGIKLGDSVSSYTAGWNFNIKNNTFGMNAKGIWIYREARNVSIEGNYMEESRTSGDLSIVVGDASYTSYGINIVNNLLSGSSTANYGIQLVNCSGVTIRGNTHNNYLTHLVNNSGGASVSRVYFYENERYAGSHGDTAAANEGGFTIYQSSNTPIFAFIRSSSGADSTYWRVEGDSYARLKVQSDGALRWSSGAATPDTNLYRSGANILRTDYDLSVGGQTYVQGTNAHLLAGTGSPEGVKTASVGSLYLRTDGGASTTLYVKESGAGNTGWVAK